MGRGLGRLIPFAAAVALVALAGCGGGASGSGDGLSVQVTQEPFGVTVIDDGKTVVAEAAGSRLAYRLSSGAEHRLTRVLSADGDTYEVATDEPGRTASVTVSPTGTGARIAVRLQPAAGVADVYDAFETTPGEHFLGGGERSGGVDLRGQILSVKVASGCSYAPIPFFASSAGWGLRLATENVAALAFPGSAGGGGCPAGGGESCSFTPLARQAEVCVQGARLDEDLYVGSIPETLSDYEADTGLPAVPPPSELQLIKWRDVVSGASQVLEDVNRLQGAGIPLGWVLIDNPWESCNGQLTFDPSRFPDPGRMIEQVHARGVKVMLWISPREICADGYPPGSLLGTGSQQVLDLRKPAAVAEFQARLRRLVALGVQGFKGDRGDETDLEPVAPALDNEYPLLYARAAMAVLPKGGAAIFRAATVGSQAVLPGIWAGDQDETWDGLQQAIVAAQTAAMSGFPTWGSDIGGYRANAAFGADVFERWAQFGSLSPVMEVGGEGANSTPWTLGAEAMAVLRSAAVLHYELFPYLYGLLQQHQPVLRPLAYAYPRDAHSWASPLELLVGPDLLAAPVTAPGVTPSVYLPHGSWVDLYTGNPAPGGGPTFTRPTPMTELPLYIRLGAVVPFDLRTAKSSWWGLNELAHPGRAGFLTTNGAVLDLSGQPRDVQIFVSSPARPHRVTLGGHPVAWSWNAGPLPGVVIRLHGPEVRGRVVAS